MMETPKRFDRDFLYKHDPECGLFKCPRTDCTCDVAITILDEMRRYVETGAYSIVYPKDMMLTESLMCNACCHEEDESHRAGLEQAAFTAITKLVGDADKARVVLDAICEGEIPGLKIEFGD